MGPERKEHPIEAPLREFRHIKRYWDPSQETVIAKILPGEFYVTNQDEMIVTVLGSCISACVHDPLNGIGGMNHFMLPERTGKESAAASSKYPSLAARYGTYAMESLINTILKYGGQRSNLEVKIFGGGRVLQKMTDIGRRNIEFVQSYIQTESLNLLAGDLGGVFPRKVVYFPVTGRARVKKLRSMQGREVALQENRYLDSLGRDRLDGDIELF